MPSVHMHIQYDAIYDEQQCKVGLPGAFVLSLMNMSNERYLGQWWPIHR